MKTTNKDLHEIQEYEETTRSYDTRYCASIRHKGLDKFRSLKDLNYSILEKKVQDQFVKWDQTWEKVVSKNKQVADKEASLNLAEEKTREAQDAQNEIENILLHTLEVDDTVDWETLKQIKSFDKINPKENLLSELKLISDPPKPKYRSKPTKPEKTDFAPKFSFLDKLIPSFKEKKIKRSEDDYQIAKRNWDQLSIEIDDQNKKIETDYLKKRQKSEEKRAALRNQYDELEQIWKQEEIDYYKAQGEHNTKVEELKEKYHGQNAEAVIEYCEIVLNNSEYPASFPKNFDLEYNPENKCLIVEYFLPNPENVPTLLEVKYVAAKKELKEVHLPEVQISKIYDSLIYKITLRTIHELFEADKINALELIVFNGLVNALNKGTGKKVNNCIVSIQVKKSDFLEIELSNIDPKSCFKNLKGVGSSKLYGITPISPIVQINKNDKRFVASYDVADSLSEGDNLAAMDWEDFEHLLRELFEKEFKSNGGEVKVTRASRDGGVDAVAFDPDPIRGGKIVIQAKRYTNTVGVSAVRDLYGTVLNEGATKGILVTTADFGPDAYEFVSNKPLTLMNGSNLLILLEKHGHKARINIDEARKQQQGF